jgi:hypothetical protein
MKRGIRLMALGLAIAVNGAALMAVNASIVDGAERELLSQLQPERVVIVEKRQDLPANQAVASQLLSASRPDLDIGAEPAAREAPMEIPLQPL